MTAQQQYPTSVKNLPEYNTIFRKHIIPADRPGHNYYDADNINFVNDLDNIEPNIIVIDSASRNWNKEDSNNYTIYLAEKLQYVHSIELIDGYVPASGYLINENNNVIYFCEKKTVIITACVEPGNYDIKRLLKSLSSTMTEASHNHQSYKCTLNPLTNKVSISSDSVFKLLFADGTEVVGDRGTMETLVINPITGKKELRKVETSDSRSRYAKNSIGKILGFKAVDLDNESSYTGQMIFALRPYSYLGIFVNTENDDDFNNISSPSPDNGIDGAFAVVSLDKNNLCYDLHYHQVVDNGRYIKTFNPPIHFSKIKIHYQTVDGHLYNFNGVDNYLVFEVKRAFGKEIPKSLKNLT